MYCYIEYNSNVLLFFLDVNQSGAIDIKDFDLAVQVSKFFFFYFSSFCLSLHSIASFLLFAFISIRIRYSRARDDLAVYLVFQRICNSRHLKPDDTTSQHIKETLNKVWEGLKQRADADQDGQVQRYSNSLSL